MTDQNTKIEHPDWDIIFPEHYSRIYTQINLEHLPIINLTCLWRIPDNKLFIGFTKNELVKSDNSSLVAEFLNNINLWRRNAPNISWELTGDLSKAHIIVCFFSNENLTTKRKTQSFLGRESEGRLNRDKNSPTMFIETKGIGKNTEEKKFL